MADRVTQRTCAGWRGGATAVDILKREGENMSGTLSVRALHQQASERLVGDARVLVGGDWIGSTSEGTLDHTDPTTGEVQGRIVVSGSAEVDQAVQAAREAQPLWRDTPPDEKRRLMTRLGAIIRENIEEFEVLGALDNGTVRGTARAAALRGADFFDYYGGWIDKLHGLVVPTYPGNALDYTVPEPFGVVAALINWNGPISATGRKVSAALAAGNAVVIKPPELAPFAIQRLGELFVDAGLPPGLVNIVPGGPATGAALVGHRGIDKISFTGSTGTARKVMASAAENLTPLALELGGKSANIVSADANLDAAAEMSAVMGAVAYAGQGCLLPTRLLVHDSIYDEFMERVVAIVESKKVGDPLDAGSDMGPLVNSDSRDRVESMIREAEGGGAKLLSGGGRVGGELGEGAFLRPTVFGDVDTDSRLAQEEVFGPVLSAFRYRSDDEAVAIANGTAFTLAAYVHTTDLARAHGMAKLLTANSVSINGSNPLPPGVPFGGSGESGFGREGGEEGVREFIRSRNVYISL